VPSCHNRGAAIIILRAVIIVGEEEPWHLAPPRNLAWVAPMHTP
jgi:hypothetical protein